MLQIPIPFEERVFPLLETRAADQIATQLQAELLDYRLRSHQRVRNSSFDAPSLTPETREVARSLGAAIVDLLLAEALQPIPECYAPGDMMEIILGITDQFGEEHTVPIELSVELWSEPHVVWTQRRGGGLFDPSGGGDGSCVPTNESAIDKPTHPVREQAHCNPLNFHEK